MAKWELIDDADAPENLSGMTEDAREKLEMLRALTPGKTAKQRVEPAKHRGFKAAVSRIATNQGLTVEVWSSADNQFVCVRLKPPSA
jgi:hypothetical protein